MRELAKRIHEETGMYVSVSEHFHESGVVNISVSIRTGEANFKWFTASTSLFDDKSPIVARQEMLDWLGRYHDSR